MAIRLEKGQRINLRKENGTELTQFCVGCNWGALVKRGGLFGLSKTVVDVDLDLSCLLFDAEGKVVDYIYSPLYNFYRQPQYKLPQGKLTTADGALHHTGDDTQGDTNGDDGLDNEIITVDLKRLNPKINSIVFFLNIFNNKDYEGDFSGIPYAYIRMYEGTPTHVDKVFAQYDVSTKTDCAGMRGLVLGRLYRRNGDWRFNAIGDAFADKFIMNTIYRVMKDYSK